MVVRMTDTSAEDKTSAGPMSRKWHYHPELPIEYAPYWHWPPRLPALLKWFWKNWLTPSDRSLYLVFAGAVAFSMQPVTEAQIILSADWVAFVFLRNFLAVLVVAGGLHLWFNRFGAQAKRLKFDPREMAARENKLFTFNHQVRDNIFFTLAFGVPIASAFETGLRWAYANNILWQVSFADDWLWFISLFPLLAIWQGIHFYLIHRLLHWPPLYRRVHHIHHRNVNVGPWSGLSMHPVEVALYLSAVLIFFAIPSHPMHMLFLLYWLMLGAVSSHSGFEAVELSDKSGIAVGSFFHQLHHRYFECNYGNSEIPMDKWFASFHDGTEAANQAVKDRKRRMHSR